MSDEAVQSADEGFRELTEGARARALDWSTDTGALRNDVDELADVVEILLQQRDIWKVIADAHNEAHVASEQRYRERLVEVAQAGDVLNAHLSDPAPMEISENWLEATKGIERA